MHNEGDVAAVAEQPIIQNDDSGSWLYPYYPSMLHSFPKVKSRLGRSGRSKNCRPGTNQVALSSDVSTDNDDSITDDGKLKEKPAAMSWLRETPGKPVFHEASQITPNQEVFKNVANSTHKTANLFEKQSNRTDNDSGLDMSFQASMFSCSKTNDKSGNFMFNPIPEQTTPFKCPEDARGKYDVLQDLVNKERGLPKEQTKFLDAPKPYYVDSIHVEKENVNSIPLKHSLFGAKLDSITDFVFPTANLDFTGKHSNPDGNKRSIFERMNDRFSKPCPETLMEHKIETRDYQNAKRSLTTIDQCKRPNSFYNPCNLKDNTCIPLDSKISHENLIIKQNSVENGATDIIPVCTKDIGLNQEGSANVPPQPALIVIQNNTTDGFISREQLVNQQTMNPPAAVGFTDGCYSIDDREALNTNTNIPYNFQSATTNRGIVNPPPVNSLNPSITNNKLVNKKTENIHIAACFQSKEIKNQQTVHPSIATPQTTVLPIASGFASKENGYPKPEMFLINTGFTNEVVNQHIANPSSAAGFPNIELANPQTVYSSTVADSTTRKEMMHLQNENHFSAGSVCNVVVHPQTAKPNSVGFAPKGIVNEQTVNPPIAPSRKEVVKLEAVNAQISNAFASNEIMNQQTLNHCIALGTEGQRVVNPSKANASIFNGIADLMERPTNLAVPASLPSHQAASPLADTPDSTPSPPTIMASNQYDSENKIKKNCSGGLVSQRVVVPLQPTAVRNVPEEKQYLTVKQTQQRPLPTVTTRLAGDNFKFSLPRPVQTKTSREYMYVNNKTYSILCMLGRGGSSEVYQVLEADNGGAGSAPCLRAIKCVNLSMVDPIIAESYLNEIELLRRLQGCSSVIHMFDYEYVKHKKMVYVVMEKGDTDLSKLIKEISKKKKISLSMIIYYWTEMLLAVKEIHDRGVIHSDLKPANFLLVSGRLKLIDFGIASSLQGDMTSVLKDVATGTWNYMSPEAICNNGATGKGYKITYRSDVWSLGCILYNLIYGKTPFSDINNMWGKMQAITDPKHQIKFPQVQIEGRRVPPVLCQAMRECLVRDPKQRPSVAELLDRPYYDAPSQLASKIKEVLPEAAWATISHFFSET